MNNTSAWRLTCTLCPNVEYLSRTPARWRPVSGNHKEIFAVLYVSIMEQDITDNFKANWTNVATCCRRIHGRGILPWVSCWQLINTTYCKCVDVSKETNTRHCYYPLFHCYLSTSFGWGKGWNVTSAGWQVTLCDPIWHASFSSSVATSVSELLYPCYFTFTLRSTHSHHFPDSTNFPDFQ